MVDLKTKKEELLSKISKSAESKNLFKSINKITEPIKRFQKKMQENLSPLLSIGKRLNEQSMELKNSINETIKREAEHEAQAFIQTEQNKKMIKISGENLKLSKKYFILAIVTLILTISFMFGIAIWENNQETARQTSQLISEIDSLDLELIQILNGIEELTLNSDNIIKDRTPFQFPLENLKENSFNFKIRNETMKRRVIVLYNRILQLNTFLEWDTPSIFQYLDETEEIIDILRDKFSDYKNCLIEKKDFNKC